MVKGLAKLGNRLRHGRKAKYVDASPFGMAKGGYSPMTGRIVQGKANCVHRGRAAREGNCSEGGRRTGPDACAIRARREGRCGL